MEATPSTSSRGRILSFPCLAVWTTFTWPLCCARESSVSAARGWLGLSLARGLGFWFWKLGKFSDYYFAILEMRTLCCDQRPIASKIGCLPGRNLDRQRRRQAARAARPRATFAPSGKVVVSALARLRKGGVVAINAIHLDQMPAFDYDKLLWGSGRFEVWRT
jgi:hypothetical protein